MKNLSAAEAAMLDEAGFVEGTPDESDALERSRVEYELLLRESLSLIEAAMDLGTSPRCLRVRLAMATRSLYGIKNGRAWRIPRFQFQERGQLVRNLGKVLPHIRPDAHPLEVKAWFDLPHVDLTGTDDDEPITPLAWLAAGKPTEVVADLAEQI